MSLEPLKPYQKLPTIFGDVEVISYPFDENGTKMVMLRLIVGDPTSMRQVRVDDLEGVLRLGDRHGDNPAVDALVNKL